MFMGRIIANGFHTYRVRLGKIINSSRGSFINDVCGNLGFLDTFFMR